MNMHGWRLNFLTGQNNRFYPLTEVSLHFNVRKLNRF